MFNREAWIANWRQALLAHEALLAEDVDELEDHLRLAVVHLEAEGLSEEAACLAAAQRLGQAEGLAQEFGKVNGRALWAQRLFWMIAGLLVIPLGTGLCTLAGSLWSMLVGQITQSPALVSWAYYGSVALGVPLSVGLGVAVLLDARRRQRWLGSVFQWAQRRPVGGVILLMLVWVVPQLITQWGNFAIARQVLSGSVELGGLLLNSDRFVSLFVNLALSIFWSGLWLWLNSRPAIASQALPEANSRAWWVRRLRWGIAGLLLVQLWEAACVLCARVLGSAAVQLWQSARLGGGVYGVVMAGVPLGIGLAAVGCLNAPRLWRGAALPAARRQRILTVAVLAGLALLLGLRLANGLFPGMVYVHLFGTSQAYGEFLLGWNVVDFVKALMLPAFWGGLLLWLNRQYTPRLA